MIRGSYSNDAETYVPLRDEHTEYSQDPLYSLDRRLCGNPGCFWEEKYLFPLPGIET
jgi:hypothetical protein